MSREEVIAEFLKNNPKYGKVEYKPELKQMTCFFFDSLTIPWNKSEFKVNSPTWKLLDDLEKKLAATEN